VNLVQFFAEYAIRGIFAGNATITWQIVRINQKTINLQIFTNIRVRKGTLWFGERISKHYGIAVIW
jgi:hypothetical protein